MPTGWFEGEGIAAIASAAIFAIGGLLVLAWLRGPGSRPYDPPISRAGVRGFAFMLFVLAGQFAIRAVWGPGGFIVTSGLLVIALDVAVVVRRRKRARPS